MTIPELAAALALTANDLLAIYDAEATNPNEPTQKITAQQLADAVKTLGSLLGMSDVVDNLTSTSTTAPLSANMGKSLNDKMTQLISVSLSGTTDENGNVPTSGLTQSDYPIAFIAGANSSDVVTFFDGSQGAGYQKYAHFQTKKNTAITGTVVCIRGTIQS